jgi:hypothetical protein
MPRHRFTTITAGVPNLEEPAASHTELGAVDDRDVLTRHNRWLQDSRGVNRSNLSLLPHPR